MGRNDRKTDRPDTGTHRWKWPSSDGPAPELRVFKTACYEIARRTGGLVERVSDGSFPPNFHDAVLARHDRTVAVLCHHWLPLLALADVPADSGWGFRMSFVDDPSIGPPLSALLNVRLLTAAELGLDWSRAGYPPAEVAHPQDLAYWRPGSVGDVIFNHWD
jgi:hypothetical protein